MNMVLYKHINMDGGKMSKLERLLRQEYRKKLGKGKYRGYYKSDIDDQIGGRAEYIGNERVVRTKKGKYARQEYDIVDAGEDKKGTYNLLKGSEPDDSMTRKQLKEYINALAADDRAAKRAFAFAPKGRKNYMKAKKER